MPAANWGSCTPISTSLMKLSPSYEQALKINLENATLHYRLGQSLVRTGATARAKEEIREI